MDIFLGFVSEMESHRLSSPSEGLRGPILLTGQKCKTVTTSVGETGAPWDMGHREAGLFDTEIILRFVRHLVNGTKTNQFPFSSLLLMAVGHPWHVCKLRSIFYIKSTFLR